MGMSKHDNSCILIISDLQAPYMHKDAIDFLKEINKQFKPTRVINIGDLADFHRLNFHGANPNLPDAVSELKSLRAFVKNLAKVFPLMEIVSSNHDALPIRKARSVGIPDEMMKDIGSIMGAPAGWKFVSRIKTLLPNGIKALFCHNFSSNLLLDSMRQGLSLICGHLHSKSLLQWWQNETLGMNFAMQVGCLIDDSSPAFDYNKQQAMRPVLTAAIIKNGIPFLIPFYVNKKNEWKGYI